MRVNSRVFTEEVDCDTCPIVKQCPAPKDKYHFPDIFKLTTLEINCPLIKFIGDKQDESKS